MLSGSTREAWSWVLSVALVVGACAAGSGPAVPTASPAGVTTSPATAGVGATPSVPPTAPSTQPPDAALAAEGGDPVIGQLGSFTWGASGSDSPWLPGARLAVGVGERLTVSIAGHVGVVAWSARRVKAGSSDGAGAVGLGSGTATVAFTAPGPGAWSVQLTVDYGAGLGTATYYWKLTVR